MIVALLGVLALAGVAYGEQPCVDGREGRTEFGRRSSPGTVIKGATAFTIAVGTELDAVRYFRIQVARQAGSTGDGLLVIKDNELRVVDVFRMREMPIGVPMWSRRGVGNRATLRLVLPDGDPTQVKIVRTIGMPAEADKKSSYYSLQHEGQAQYHDIFPGPGQLETRASGRVKVIAESVGMVLAGSGDGSRTWCCSAVAVDEDLVLTNWHCGGDPDMLPERYWNDSVCAQTLVDMSWDGDDVSHEYQCVRVIADQARDLALIQVRGVEDAEPLVPVRLASGDTVTGLVDLIHHPECKRKQATESCHIVGLAGVGPATATEFTHDCDSEGGSSGAPLFDDQLHLIGLHHAGFRREASTCRALDKVNRGVRLEEVRAFLASARVELRGGATPP
jgi:hypothetical protein